MSKNKTFIVTAGQVHLKGNRWARRGEALRDEELGERLVKRYLSSDSIRPEKFKERMARGKADAEKERREERDRKISEMTPEERAFCLGLGKKKAEKFMEADKEGREKMISGEDESEKEKEKEKGEDKKKEK